METDYVHPPMNEEIRSISGAYVFRKEGALAHGGREVIYAVGVGVADTSCCGAGAGFPYILVPGFLVSRKKGPDGRDVSRVERIEDPRDREAVARALQEREGRLDVQFL
ncbi:MAG: hypothetical protein ABIM40_03490 [Pseudomonadota bacterium]